MRRISALTYSVSAGEQIEVQVVQSTGLASMVNYSECHPPSVPKNNPCRFTVQQPTVLVQTVFFTDQTGGSCVTQVTGDPAGDPPDLVSFNRAGTEAFHNLAYTFLTQAEFANMGPALNALSPAASAPDETEGAAEKATKTTGSKKPVKGGRKE